MILVNLPHIVVITVPMALLFGLLVAVGRLSADSELVALRASGQSLFSVLRPILVVCAVLAALNVFLMSYLQPRGNSALLRLTSEIMASSVARQVEPRVFYEEWQGLLLWVFEAVPGEDDWNGIFLANNRPGADNTIKVAESGRVRLDETGRNLILDLTGVTSHTVDFNEPERYEAASSELLTEVVDDPLSLQLERQRRVNKGVRSLTLGELRTTMHNEKMPPELRRLARVEIHKKFAIPAACLVFGVLGLVLGFRRQRTGGRTAGFALSIAVIIVYWVLMSNGEKAAQVGRVPPWLAIWAPNIVLGTLGLVALYRLNRDRLVLPAAALSPFGRAARALTARFRKKKNDAVPAAGSPDASREIEATATEVPGVAEETGLEPAAPARKAAPDVVLRLSPVSPRFLQLMDRYVLRQFLWAFLLILASGVAVFTVADLTEKIDEILKNKIPLETVLQYYKYASFQRIYDLAPFSVLVTTLTVFGLMAKSNELIAAKASGLSVYRLAVPAVLGALAVVGLCGLLQARILASANQKVAQLEDQISGTKVVRSYRRADRNWLFGQGRYIYNFLRYDRATNTIHKLQVFEFDQDHRLVKRLYADKVSYVGDGWRFEDAWTRTFDGRETLEFRRYDKPVFDRFPEVPEYFEDEIRRPNALGYGALKRHIGELEASGQSVPELKVELQTKFGYPAICVVMALVALPYSFRLGRKGALYGIGIGIILGMAFMGVYAFSTMLGGTGALPPIVAVWSPAIAFVLISLYGFLGRRDLKSARYPAGRFLDAPDGSILAR